MGAIIRLLFPLIAYFCVASVVTIVSGYAYLRHSGKLDDDRLFRIAALVHGVDLEAIAATYDTGVGEVPPEELSYAEQQQERRVALLQMQSKHNEVKQELDEFDHQLRRLNIATSRYQALRHDVENYLKNQSAKSMETGQVTFRDQLRTLNPKRQAKPLLVKMIRDNRVDEVILALNGLPARNREAILLTFDTPEDLDMLYRIQERILAGHPIKPFIDRKLQDLNALKQKER